VIHELSHLNSKQVLSEGSMVHTGNALDKKMMVNLSKIQLGDVLSGKIIFQDHQAMLKLESGLSLLAHLPKSVVPNQLGDFLVTGKSGQHLEVEQIQINQSAGKHQTLEESIMKEMHLPNTSEMKQMVEQWMNQGLPMIKNQMLQAYHMVKNYDLPSELLVNLSENRVYLSEEEIRLVTQFKAEGITILDGAIEEAFSQITHKAAVKFNHALIENMTPSHLRTMLEEVLSQQTTNENTSNRMVYSNESQIDFQDVGKAQMSLRDVLNQISQMQPDNFEENGALYVALKDMLQTLPKEELKELSKQLIHKYMVISEDELRENPEEIIKLGELSKRLETIASQIKEHIGEEIIKEPLQQLEQTAQILEKYHVDGQYYCFPLQIKEQHTSGELYFFKPKKHKKSTQDDKGMYIVLALEMPALKHIEVHLIEHHEELALKIKVGNEAILKQIKENQAQLRALMDETMMPIGDIEIEQLEERLEQKIPRKESISSRLDFRI